MKPPTSVELRLGQVDSINAFCKRSSRSRLVIWTRVSHFCSISPIVQSGRDSIELSSRIDGWIASHQPDKYSTDRQNRLNMGDRERALSGDPDHSSLRIPPRPCRLGSVNGPKNSETSAQQRIRQQTEASRNRSEHATNVTTESHVGFAHCISVQGFLLRWSHFYRRLRSSFVTCPLPTRLNS